MKNDKNLERDRIEYVYQQYLSNKKVLKKWSNKNIGNQISLEERHNRVKGFFIKNNFDIKNNKILDLGCAGGNFIGTLLDIGARKKNITGIDIRKNSIKNAVNSFPGICFELMDARQLKFPDNSFDLVFSLNTFHNLHNYDLEKALNEFQRVGKLHKYICVESYRNESEKANLLYWQVTCESFCTPMEWEWWFSKTNYDGDHSFIYFE